MPYAWWLQRSCACFALWCVISSAATTTMPCSTPTPLPDTAAVLPSSHPSNPLPNTCTTQVQDALSALTEVRAHIAAGAYHEASASARAARAAAEAAFLHPAVLAKLNFPESHKMGIYMPLFLPVSVPLLQGLGAEALRSARRWREFRTAAAAAATALAVT